MIVVVGLGNMGAAVAERLVRTGHEVAAVELSEAIRREWTERSGVDALGSLADVDWATTERVLVVVRLTTQADAVLQEIALRAAGRQLPVLVMTTLDVDFARALERHEYADLLVLETPISGGDALALAGGLTVMVAGPHTTEDIAFLTGSLADHVEHFPRYGQPTLAKLLNNVGCYYNAAAMTELLLLADRHGLDPNRLRRVLDHSSGGAWVTSRFERLLDDLLVKDASLLAAEVGALPAVSPADGEVFSTRFSAARALLDTDPADPVEPSGPPVVHRHSVRLSYGDCDPAGIIYYAAWLPMMERVLSEWFVESGHRLDTMAESLGATPVTRAISCDYLAAAGVHDLVDVAMHVEHVGHSSYRLGFEITRTDDDEVVARAAISCVTVREGRPVGLPPALRGLLTGAQGTDAR
jgi:acyl-CoA thioester hydrolase